MSNYRRGVRVIGGRWRGRKIPVADVPGLRPTSDRIRETLFNWLRLHIDGARCLDLFAGSGALSFEALSRGASHVTAVDANHKSIEAMRKTADLFGVSGLHLVCDRAERMLASNPGPAYDIVFVDPPFGFADYAATLDLLHGGGWLSSTALIYVESDKGDDFTFPVDWVRLKDGEAGKVRYQLLQREHC